MFKIDSYVRVSKMTTKFKVHPIEKDGVKIYMIGTTDANKLLAIHRKEVQEPRRKKTKNARATRY